MPSDHDSTTPAPEAGGDASASAKHGDLQKNITMAQIAKAAGVSQGAISSLLNDRDYGIRVSEKTRERVFKVCRDMGYIPNDLRAVVRMYPEMGDTCLLVSERFASGTEHPVVARVLAGATRANGAMTIGVYSESEPYATNESLPQPVAQGVVSKFLLLGGPNPALIQAIQRRGAVAVHLGLDSGSPGTLSLLPDYTEAARLGLEYLFEKGHRKIGIVSGPFGTAEPHHIELNRGVRVACEHFNVSIESLAIFYGDLTTRAGAEALEASLQRGAAVTAFFCMSDEAAAGLIALASARGLAVPVKLSVVGCGDDPLASLTHPGLTTVRLPLAEIGALGVKESDAIVRGTAPEGRRKLVPVQLIERSSVAAAPSLR